MKNKVNSNESGYETIIDFMSNPAVRNIPGFSGFEKAVANMMAGIEKEQILTMSNSYEIAEGIHECTCPSCGGKNTIVEEFHDGNTHYCRKCGRKVKHK